MEPALKFGEAACCMAWTMALATALSACGSSSSHGSGAGGTSGAGGGVGGGGGTAGGTGGTGGGINPGGGQLLPFIQDSDGITMVIDSSGALHVGALAKVNGTPNVVYAKCQSQCDVESSWISVGLGEAEASYPPTVQVTADGRPRLAYDVVLSGSPGFYYAECDAACDNAANWQTVRVTQDVEVTGLLRPKVPFAVSPNGSAALADQDNSGSFVYYCTAGCGNAAAWTKFQIGDAYLSPKAITFGKDENLQVVAQQLVGQSEVQLQWFGCNGDCLQPSSWSGIQGLWVTQGSAGIEAALAKTPQGAPRILIYGDDTQTPTNENVFAFASCDNQCSTPTNWSLINAPLPVNGGDRGFDVIVDGAGKPTLAYESDTQLAFTTCTGDCTTGAGWQPLQGVETGFLDQSIPFTIPTDCNQGYWMMQTGPSLAVTPDGRLSIAFTGSERASGGSCGTDTFIASQSFITLP